jgi:hypothetical protein
MAYEIDTHADPDAVQAAVRQGIRTADRPTCRRAIAEAVGGRGVFSDGARNACGEESALRPTA